MTESAAGVVDFTGEDDDAAAYKLFDDMREGKTPRTEPGPSRTGSIEGFVVAT